ncbi:MAG: UDP-N-acetylmuramate--L-alanine ligase [Gammaproteobacteria bacterium]|nr:UDP-N-acetylmuramate--L-alanine ligase [Gammaproteobacteria bacterium]NNF49506.1 UDP-N-acetylmuramate--L-alanine ligase [Woeseiaceae bacterium]MBT8094214.1 UDP-N-acetylmuramate--L-alanine ligase [Gammaproteobacteria bacterium]MBT8104573.1 UDP-N-acetylmuramate--L-alanine ligase [Gammaproteobacteria bacterium]NNK24587.1 UDP-N-acetylmuramate--L-alanine ligase [Woeseiaceae bacterium]
MRRIQTMHFVGIGGSGMSGIAEVMLNLGYAVQGSDLGANKQTRRLEGQGATVFIGHAAGHIEGADAVVVSSAVDDTNPEVAAARERRMPVVSRAEMLAELMRFRYSIAVAGTHGKTTTTSLVASVLAEGGLDPTFVIGGRLKSADANARLGQGDYLVAEADESDASFVHLKPMLAVVTNIDADHMETYDGDIERLKSGFIEFLHNLPFYGLTVVCTDDPGVNDILDDIGRSVTTYGTNEDADVRAVKIEYHEDFTKFDVVRSGDTFQVSPENPSTGVERTHGDTRSVSPVMHVTLRLPGLHNVRNALAAIAVADELQIADKAVIAALENFEGIDRRFQSLGEVRIKAGTVRIVDDYGHHPTEVAATLSAAKAAYPDRRIVLVFQPHRYTRTRDLMDDFANVLSDADALVLLDVYAAGEELISGADGRTLARAVRTRGAIDPVFVERLDDLADVLGGVLRDGDLVLTMGAGDIGAYAQSLPQLLGDAPSLQVHS